MTKNENMEKLLTMYSQSRISNIGTRGYDSDTHVTLMLDEKLVPKIEMGDFSFLCITGNAGDGKTTLLQRFEESCKEKGAVFEKTGSNGTRFVYLGKTFSTVYDGSQDEGSIDSNEILKDFLREFEGDYPPNLKGKIVKLIAINEGRLLHFLSKNRTLYGWLYKEITMQLDEGKSSSQDVLVINLNLRSIVDGDILNYKERSSSIFDKQLDNILSESNWKSCESCDIANKCPVKFNIESFRSNNIIRQRFKFLFQITFFRKKLHMTIRDLRSVLSYVLLGVRNCAEIRKDIGDHKKNLKFIYYNSSFEKNEKDRLVKIRADLDVANMSNPRLDNQLNFNSPSEQTFYINVENRSNLDIDILSDIYRRRPESIFDTDHVKEENARTYHECMRRKYFFENNVFSVQNDANLSESMIPTLNVREFANFLLGNIENKIILDSIIIGLNRGEGIRDTRFVNNAFCVRTTKKQNNTKAYHVFPIEDFEVRIKARENDTSYIEFIAGSIELIYIPKNVVLEINLELYEAIMRMKKGYTPSTAELKGFFQNVQIFKKRILGSGRGSSMIIEEEGKIIKISTDKNGNIRLEE